jgi:hypothetical protein
VCGDAPDLRIAGTITAVREEDLIRALKYLVAVGEYLDEIPGVRGVRLDGGGVFQDDRRMYERGTAEHLEARDGGLVEKLPPLAPATPEAVEEAEQVIGHNLPPLLRRLYLEVGNGGFGPGYGLLGVPGGHRDDLRNTAIDLYRKWHDGGDRELPGGPLPICYWGCGIYSFVDCRTEPHAMWACDPNPGVEDDLFREHVTLADWLDQWIHGRLHQPALVEDPETGEIRPATEADWEDA